MLKVTFFIIFIAGVLAAKGKWKILNGKNVGHLIGNEVLNPGAFPFMTLLRIFKYEGGQRREQRCGASIIRADAVLTAAHCVVDTAPQDLTIFGGIVNTQLRQKYAQIKWVRKYIIHENYSLLSEPKPNDIAIVFLDSPFQITKFVSPIDLPTASDYILDSIATVPGWGVDERGESPNWLQDTNLQVISNDVCQDYANVVNKIVITTNKQNLTDDMLCALNTQKSTVCQGDSGSPLVYKKKLIGITTWVFGIISLPSIGINTCDPYYPAVFIKVGNYVDWINNKLQSN